MKLNINRFPRNQKVTFMHRKVRSEVGRGSASIFFTPPPYEEQVGSSSTLLLFDLINNFNYYN